MVASDIYFKQLQILLQLNFCIRGTFGRSSIRGFSISISRSCFRNWDFLNTFFVYNILSFCKDDLSIATLTSASSLVASASGLPGSACKIVTNQSLIYQHLADIFIQINIRNSFKFTFFFFWKAKKLFQLIILIYSKKCKEIH